MIPFNRPAIVGPEYDYIRTAAEEFHLSGDGKFTKRCHAMLEALTGTSRALLTHSCTAALEMSAMLADIEPSDEVIMPSFTFVSTANAFALRGAVPVFVDVRADTFNLDETRVEQAVTARTRAIVPVHYAGVACDMDALRKIAARHGLMLIEDAAQGVGSTWRGQPLGSIGDLGSLSFHETKNIIAGEGGALLVNRADLIARAEIVREKGTNRSQFYRGQVDKYTWVDLGSSFLPSELTAAFLCAQLEHAEQLTSERLQLWERYHLAFEDIEADGLVRRPIVPVGCGHNAHMYYLLLPDLEMRQRFIADLRSTGIGAVFHYVPLHSSRAGLRYGRVSGSMDNTVVASDRLVRLPMWNGLAPYQDQVIDAVREALRRPSLPSR